MPPFDNLTAAQLKLAEAETDLSLRRHEDITIATHQSDYREQQQRQQDESYRTVNSALTDATLGSSELSCLALRSTVNSCTADNEKPQFPSLTQTIQTVPLAGGLLTTHQRRLHAVEHAEENLDSGICELTTKLNR